MRSWSASDCRCFLVDQPQIDAFCGVGRCELSSYLARLQQHDDELQLLFICNSEEQGNVTSEYTLQASMLLLLIALLTTAQQKISKLRLCTLHCKSKQCYSFRC